MPTLTIDNRTVTVPDGANVLEAAQALGIAVPHFCYHEALGSVGSCRLCAVTFVEGPVKGVQMSCMVPAKDGMVVLTGDAAACEQREHIAEWLMMNHPHDCPVCDEGGECRLQEMTIASEHTLRRYDGKKITRQNQDLGPFVVQESNRCIQCYRCVRTYRDYCGGADFGVMGSRQRLFFGRMRPGRLESPFSGNLVDVCPTGVFTDRTFRYTSRSWDLQEAMSICPHCSVGCATFPGARFRELQRVKAGVDRDVNGFFICDRGRFGYAHANHPKRLRAARIGEEQVDPSQALDALDRQLADIIGLHGVHSVALLASPHASLETMGLLKLWSERLGGAHVVFDDRALRDRTVRASLPLPHRSLAEIGRSDCVVLVGVDPMNEGPLLALAVRQAVRRGGIAAHLDPRPVELPCAATRLPLAPERLALAIEALASGDLAPFSGQEKSILSGIAARLKGAKNPVLIGGEILGPEGVSALRRAAERLATDDRPCGATLLPSDFNSFGAALMAEEGPYLCDLLDAVDAGQVRAMVCVEADPFGEHYDRSRVEKAMARLELLAAFETLPTETARRAQILLPTAVPAEYDGSVLNHAGQLRTFARVFPPGDPLRQTADGGHPLRAFRPDTPGESPRPAWEWLAQLLEIEPGIAAARAAILNEIPHMAEIFAGTAVAPDMPREESESSPESSRTEGLHLLTVETLFGSELLASFSSPLAPMVPGPHLFIHPSDAAPLNLKEGDAVGVEAGGETFPLVVRVMDDMAAGLVIVPRIRGTATERLIPGSGTLPCRIVKRAP